MVLSSPFLRFSFVSGVKWLTTLSCLVYKLRNRRCRWNRFVFLLLSLSASSNMLLNFTLSCLGSKVFLTKVPRLKASMEKFQEYVLYSAILSLLLLSPMSVNLSYQRRTDFSYKNQKLGTLFLTYFRRSEEHTSELQSQR